MSSSPEPKRRIRLFQFSLRALLVLVTLFGVWLGVKVKKAREQRAAVAAILRLGGTVIYDYQSAVNRRPEASPPGPEWLRRLIGAEYFQEVVLVELQDTNVKDEDLKHLEVLSELRHLNLDNNRFNGSGLSHIRHLTNLEIVSLNWSDVTDEGLHHVRNLKNLTYLGLAGTPITDAGLSHLQKLSRLEDLILADVHLSDQGLKHLSSLSSIQLLNLSGTRISDRGLEELAALRALTHLYLRKTEVGDASIAVLQQFPAIEELSLEGARVTAQGFVTLKQSFPNCQIDFEAVDLCNARLSTPRWKSLSSRFTALNGENRLKYVNLSGSDITDAYLDDLADLDAMQLVDLRNTRLTPAAVESLRLKLPKCEILVDDSVASSGATLSEP